MDFSPHRALLTAVATGMAVAAGCSSEPGGQTTSAPPRSSVPQTTAAPSSPAEPPAPGEVAVSTNGVTTAVGAPADSTEEEYFQACYAARVWIDERGGDPHSQIEPYLKTVQESGSAGPGTFGAPWAQLPLSRQAAVIVAVQAAADHLCG